MAEPQSKLLDPAAGPWRFMSPIDASPAGELQPESPDRSKQCLILRAALTATRFAGLSCPSRAHPPETNPVRSEDMKAGAAWRLDPSPSFSRGPERPDR